MLGINNEYQLNPIESSKWGNKLQSQFCEKYATINIANSGDVISLIYTIEKMKYTANTVARRFSGDRRRF